MKHLRDYPYIAQAFYIIYCDQPCPASYATVTILSNAEVPEGWERMFDSTEKVLRQMSKLKIGMLIPNFAKDKHRTFEGCNGNESAFELTVMSVNDSDEQLMAAAKVPYLERDVVKHVMNAFFDGPLREVFQETKLLKYITDIGTRVRLKPNKKEGWPEQFGIYNGPSGNGVHMVTLESEYRNGKRDPDGLREVMANQIEVARATRK
jgi:hypothetical protein